MDDYLGRKKDGDKKSVIEALREQEKSVKKEDVKGEKIGRNGMER